MLRPRRPSRLCRPRRTADKSHWLLLIIPLLLLLEHSQNVLGLDVQLLLGLARGHQGLARPVVLVRGQRLLPLKQLIRQLLFPVTVGLPDGLRGAGGGAVLGGVAVTAPAGHEGSDPGPRALRVG